MTEENYRHVYVVIEHIDGKILPVSLECLERQEDYLMIST